MLYPTTWLGTKRVLVLWVIILTWHVDVVTSGRNAIIRQIAEKNARSFPMSNCYRIVDNDISVASHTVRDRVFFCFSFCRLVV